MGVFRPSCSTILFLLIVSVSSQIPPIDDLIDDVPPIDDLIDDVIDLPPLINDTANSCTELELNQNHTTAGCTVIQLVMVSGSEGFNIEEECGAPEDMIAAPNVSKAGKQLPHPLVDLRPVPYKISTEGDNWRSEGAVSFWMYRALTNFNMWAPCMVGDNATRLNTAQPVPPGWETLATLSLNETTYDMSYFEIPFATVILHESMLVVLVRGTQTKWEWLQDFTYGFANTSGTPLGGMGGIHEGFTKIALTLFEGLKPILDTHVVRGNASAVSIAGHSLGAGVSTVMSLLMADYIDEALPGPSRIKVDAFLFAPPNAGDADFNKIQAARVNVRSLVFVHDIITQIPCAPEMMTCPAGLKTRASFGLPNTMGPDEDIKSVPYRAQHGQVLLTPRDMPFQPEAWACFASLETSKVAAFLTATHSCAYMCATSAFVNETANECLLNNAKDGDIPAAASFCPGFPELFPC
ncbi:hypothetical protein FOA52_004769 [Chlamydomonas sp. UWO 241]|nr:hypothetical protein FOA52_004769 [Chlamydomonas sp. UWO 241]